MGRFFRLKNNLASLYAMVQLGRKPGAVRYVFIMGDRQDNLAEVDRLAGRITDPFSDADLDHLWRDQYRPPHYEVADLAKLPEQTLGGAYGRFMLAHGLQPDFYENVAPRHKMHFLRLRLRQTHDIWHVLSGFGTDEFGEVGLQGLYFAQVTNGQSALILTGAILKSIIHGRFQDLKLFIASFCEGFSMGQKSRNLLGVLWETHWRDDLASLRRASGIQAVGCVSIPLET